MSKVNVPALLRRLDDQAQEQLCEAVARLAEQTERLQHELMHMESSADAWREDAFYLYEQLAAATGGTRGITQSGELVVVAQHDADLQDIDGPLSPEEVAWIEAWLADSEQTTQGYLLEAAIHG
jgi:hypothetical protein